MGESRIANRHLPGTAACAARAVITAMPEALHPRPARLSGAGQFVAAVFMHALFRAR